MINICRLSGNTFLCKVKLYRTLQVRGPLSLPEFEKTDSLDEMNSPDIGDIHNC